MTVVLFTILFLVGLSNLVSLIFFRFSATPSFLAGLAEVLSTILRFRVLCFRLIILLFVRYLLLTLVPFETLSAVFSDPLAVSTFGFLSRRGFCVILGDGFFSLTELPVREVLPDLICLSVLVVGCSLGVTGGSLRELILMPMREALSELILLPEFKGGCLLVVTEGGFGLLIGLAIRDVLLKVMRLFSCGGACFVISGLGTASLLASKGP